ncbi:hypothetical protein COT98_02945, partial [Candidatus Falkowbacteria bacterium CG10_big_fil_rev_8_21_14_0_10_39_9]
MENNKTSDKPLVAAGPVKKSMLGVDDLVSGSIKMYKQHFKKFMLMLLVSFTAYLPFYLISAWLAVNANMILGIILVILFLVALVALIYFGVRSQIG